MILILAKVKLILLLTFERIYVILIFVLQKNIEDLLLQLLDSGLLMRNQDVKYFNENGFLTMLLDHIDKVIKLFLGDLQTQFNIIPQNVDQEVNISQVYVNLLHEHVEFLKENPKKKVIHKRREKY